MAKAARKSYQPQMDYIAISVAYNTPNIGTANMVQIGTLPSGCVLSHAIVSVTTAFNAATTNVLIVGTSSDDDAFVAAGDVNEGAVGGAFVTRPAGVAVTAETPVYVKFTETGTAATAGAADVVLFYAPSVQ